MIHADLDKILPEDDALDKIKNIFQEVENEKELYVITKSGLPAAAVINIDYLEELTGQTVNRRKDIATNQDEPIQAAEKIDNEVEETVGQVVDTSDEPLIEEAEAPLPPEPPAPESQATPYNTTAPLAQAPIQAPQTTTPAPQTPPPASPASEMPQTPPPPANPEIPQAPYPETPSQPPFQPSQSPQSSHPMAEEDSELPPEAPTSGSPLG